MCNILMLTRNERVLASVEGLPKEVGLQILPIIKPSEVPVQLQTNVFDVLMSDYIFAEHNLDILISATRRSQVPIIWLVNADNMADFQADDRVRDNTYLCTPFIHTGLIAVIYAQILERKSRQIDQLHTILSNQMHAHQRRQLHLAHQLQEQLGNALNNLTMMLTISRELSTDTKTPMLDAARGMISNLQQQVSKLVFDTWPFVLESANLLPVLQHCFNRFAEHTGLQIVCHHMNLNYPLPLENRVTAYETVCDILGFLAEKNYAGNVEFDVAVANGKLRIVLGNISVTSLPQEIIGNQLLPYLDERIRACEGSVDCTAPSQGQYSLCIELPIETEPAQQEDRLKFTDKITKVVIAHQDTFTRQGLSRLLENEPDICVIGQAATLSQLDELVLHLQPNFLVLSANLLEIHEFDLIEKLKNDRAELRILLLAEGTSEKHVLEALKRGISGCITNTFNGDEFLKAFREVLSGHRFLDGSLRDRLIDAYIHGQIANQIDLDHYHSLTPREKEMLQLVAVGYKSIEIGQLLSISPRTVEKHRYNIMKKLNASSHIELNRFATRIGLVPPDKKGEMQMLERILSSNVSSNNLSH